ncbi:MAG: SulP family inorganic anion transporter [Acidithiobacillales bacterium]
MSSSGHAAAPTRLVRFAPGLPALLRYDPADFRHDLVAGLSVAAVALPVGVAYAELAGLPPVLGLYASILPLVAYAIFGTSRQLVVGPDAATCALVAASVAPLAGGDRSLYLSLSVTLAFLAGLISIGGRFLRLGALADFLSKPILVGFLNGVSISILLGQAGKIFGFSVKPGGIVQRLIDILGKLPTTHLPTLAVGVATFLVLAVAPRILPAFPRNLVAMVAAAVLVALFGLDARGVAILGEVPPGLPRLALPVVPLELLPKLIADAAGLALVTFTSMMLTARSFASKNGYDVDADREFAALGAANIAAALSQSFAVSGADSRTAVSDAAGGRTQMTGLVAAAALSLVLLFFTGPLRYVPVPALGAVLILASVSLFDVRDLRVIWQVDRVDCLLSVFVTFGVVAVGAINAILVAVVVALVRFVHIVSRPLTEVLGRVPGLPGFHGTRRHPDAETIPGVVLFRFSGPVVFFNAPHFKREALAAADAAGPGLKWFVLDAIPIPHTDATGLFVIDEVAHALKKRGVVVVAAGRVTERREWRQKHGFAETDSMAARQFPTLESAVEACLAGRVAGGLA